MSANSRTTVVQKEVQVPHLSDLNPKNSTDPLVQTLAHHEMPSNGEITSEIERVKTTLNESKVDGHLTSKGEKILSDTTEILDSVQKFINERNPDNKIQDLVHHTKEAKDELTREAEKQKRSIRHAAKSEMKEIGVPRLGVTNVAFSGPLGTIQSLSTLKSFLSHTGFKFPKSKEVKGDVKEIYHLGKEIFSYTIRSAEFREFIDELVEFLQESLDEATHKVSEVADAMIQDFDDSDLHLNNTADSIKNIGKESKKMIRAKEEWTEEKASEYYNKFSKLLVKISKKKEYKEILDLVWKWMDELVDMGFQAKDILENTIDQAKDDALNNTERLKDKVTAKASKFRFRSERNANRVKESWDRSMKRASPTFEKVWSDICAIVDGFAGEGALEDLIHNLSELAKSIYHNEEASSYLKNLRSFISDAVENPMILQDAEVKLEGRELLKNGRNVFVTGDLSGELREVLGQFKEIVGSIKDDPLTTDLLLKLRQFGHDFAYDDEGKPNVYIIQDSLSAVKDILYPIITKEIATMKVDRVAGTTDKVNWQLENVVVALPSIVPESFQLRTKNLLDFNIKELHTKKNITKVILEIKDIKPRFENIRFWYKLKSFPHLEDKGIVDVDLSSGSGLSIKIQWKIQTKENTPFSFSLMRVNCDIDKLNITLKGAKHDILDKMALPFIQGQIKQALAQGIVDGIVTAVQPINDTLNNFFSTKPIEHLKERVAEQVHMQMENANHFIQSHPLDRTVEKARQGVEDFKEMVEDDLVYAKDRVSDSIDDLRDSIKDKTETVQIKGENLKKRVQTRIGYEGKEEYVFSNDEQQDYVFSESEPKRTFKDDVNTKYNQVKERVGGKMDVYLDKGIEATQEIKEKGKEKMEEIKDDATDKLEEVKEKLPEKVEEVLDHGVEKFDDSRERLAARGERIQERADRKFEQVKKVLPSNMAKQADEYRDKVSDKLEEAHDATVDKLRETKDKMPEDSQDWKELTHDAKKKMPKNMKDVTRSVRHFKEDLEDDAIDYALDKGVPVVKRVAVEAKDKAIDLKEKGEVKYEELKQKGAEKMEQLKEQGAEKVEQIKEKASDLTEKGKEKASELKDKTEKKTEELKEKASEKTEELKEKASKKSEQVKEKVSEKSEDVKDKARDLKEKASKKSEDVKDKARDVKEKASEKSEDVKDKVKDVKEKATQKSEDVKDKVKDAKDKSSEKSGDSKDKKEKREEFSNKTVELKDIDVSLSSEATDSKSDIANTNSNTVTVTKTKTETETTVIDFNKPFGSDAKQTFGIEAEYTISGWDSNGRVTEKQPEKMAYEQTINKILEDKEHKEKSSPKLANNKINQC